MLVYKYQKIDEWFYKNLINMQIYCNSPENFNDPFESDLDIMEPIINNVKSDENKYSFFLKLRDKIEEMNINTRATCFSEDYKNELLWAHYADNHIGVCFGYELENLDKMNYSVEYPKISPKIIKMMIDCFENLSEFQYKKMKIGNELYKKSCLTKSECWSYEKEYRAFIEVDEKNDFFLNLNKENFKSVYFGLRTSEEDKRAIIKILKDKDINIPMYHMEKVKGKFKFEPKLINK